MFITQLLTIGQTIYTEGNIFWQSPFWGGSGQRCRDRRYKSSNCNNKIKTLCGMKQKQ